MAEDVRLEVDRKVSFPETTRPESTGQRSGCCVWRAARVRANTINLSM